MKYSVVALFIVLSVIPVGCSQSYKAGKPVQAEPGKAGDAVAAETICIKTGTGLSMAYDEAVKIAESSECINGGALESEHFCNQTTGTWWISLDIDKKGCNPACVVDINTKQAEINWRCTGLISE